MVLFHLMWITPCPLIYVVDTRVPAPSDGRESRKSDVYVCVCVVVLLFL